MIQEAIALFMVFAASAYTVYQGVSFFIPNKNAHSSCGSCSGCQVKNIKKPNLTALRIESTFLNK
jgi:hypothetical protein